LVPSTAGGSVVNVLFAAQLRFPQTVPALSKAQWNSPAVAWQVLQLPAQAASSAWQVKLASPPAHRAQSPAQAAWFAVHSKPALAATGAHAEQSPVHTSGRAMQLKAVSAPLHSSQLPAHAAGSARQLWSTPSCTQEEQSPPHFAGAPAQLKDVPEPTHAPQLPPHAASLALQTYSPDWSSQASQSPVQAAWIGWQVPSIPATVQLPQFPEHRPSQQTHSTQAPLAHSASSAQELPFFSLQTAVPPSGAQRPVPPPTRGQSCPTRDVVSSRQAPSVQSAATHSDGATHWIESVHSSQAPA
jgi:hypothetical protein